MPFLRLQSLFIVKHCFRTQPYEAVKQAYQMHFPDAAVPNKSNIFDLLFNGVTLHRISTNMLKLVELCLQQGLGGGAPVTYIVYM
jgi:hypothetical protein